MVRILPILLMLLTLVGCAGFEEFISQPLTTESTSTIGDSLADSVEVISDSGASMLGTVTTALTGNPVWGGGVAAIIAALIALGSRKLRSKVRSSESVSTVE